MHGIAPEMETFNHQKLANCNFRDAHPSGKPAECGGCERMKISQLICNRQRCGFQQRTWGDPTKSELEQRNKHIYIYLHYRGIFLLYLHIPIISRFQPMEGESVDFKLQHPAVKKSSRLPGRRRRPGPKFMGPWLNTAETQVTQPKPKIAIDGTHGKSIRDGKSSFLSPLLEVSMISSHCGSMNFRWTVYIHTYFLHSIYIYVFMIYDLLIYYVWYMYMYIRQDGFREWGLGDRHPWVVAATSQREEYQPGFSPSNMWSSLRQK